MSKLQDQDIILVMPSDEIDVKKSQSRRNQRVDDERDSEVGIQASGVMLDGLAKNVVHDGSFYLFGCGLFALGIKTFDNGSGNPWALAAVYFPKEKIVITGGWLVSKAHK